MNTTQSTPDAISYDSILSNLSEEDYKAEVDFLGLEPLKIKTINAQQIFNYYQMFPKILVFDLRSKK